MPAATLIGKLSIMCKCFGLYPHPLDCLFWDSQKHFIGTLGGVGGEVIFGKLRTTVMGESSGAEHTVKVRYKHLS